jgi:histidine triad (HIT) family protein
VSHDPSCIFCKIATGQIPSSRVLETAEAVVFLDINPVNLGHILLVPKAHHATIAELPDDLAAAAGLLLPRLCRAVLSVSGADGLNVIMNMGRVAGQTVDHVHWHVIPRSQGDAVRWPWPHVAYQGQELETLRSRLEQALKPAKA